MLVKSSLIVLLAILPAWAGGWVCPCCDRSAPAALTMAESSRADEHAGCCPDSARQRENRTTPDGTPDGPAGHGQDGCNHCDLHDPLEAAPVREVMAVVVRGDSLELLLQSNFATPLAIEPTALPANHAVPDGQERTPVRLSRHTLVTDHVLLLI